MQKFSSLTGFDVSKALFVFALESEADSEFDDVRKLITGIGKVQAAYALTNALRTEDVGLVVNLGSAGSTQFSRGEVVCCTQFVQRDMDVRELGFPLYETPLSGIPPVLNYGLSLPGIPAGTCGTGDHFETNHSDAVYNVVDMEAYPLALIARKENIPFLCLKYITDGADGTAAEDWSAQVHYAAAAFRKLLFNG